jgi:hypothetical protein
MPIGSRKPWTVWKTNDFIGGAIADPLIGRIF